MQDAVIHRRSRCTLQRALRNAAPARPSSAGARRRRYSISSMAPASARMATKKNASLLTIGPIRAISWRLLGSTWLSESSCSPGDSQLHYDDHTG